ncbi:N-acetylmuramoyl-L-alanine amidase family protein [Maribacter litoralis]|uniref:N-acetylmuramoyl-L-alanine amidase family protein n=1 Tax=Maribacter litoralis TaxID=2059726 RepID=UPI003F5CF5B3
MNQRKLIVIDPGHGGIDSGAIGVNDVLEKTIVLDIAKEVLRLNRDLYKDTLDIYLTRYSDTLISLGQRMKLAKVLRADFFVSIHCNNASRREAHGIEVYFDGANKRSKQLAVLFAFGLSDKLGFKNRGVKYGNFQVLRQTTDIPSVLLELGFLSNSEEAAHNTNAASISGFALLILETLLEFLRDD